ncbi:MAG: hypothetical protein WKF30_18015 [Pyrinomonadaceae bacterium]
MSANWPRRRRLDKNAFRQGVGQAAHHDAHDAPRAQQQHRSSQSTITVNRSSTA